VHAAGFPGHVTAELSHSVSPSSESAGDTDTDDSLKDDYGNVLCWFQKPLSQSEKSENTCESLKRVGSVCEKTISETDVNNAHTTFASVFFSLHPPDASPVRGACSNLHWGIRRFCALLALDFEDVGNDTAAHPLLENTGYDLGQVVALKLDAGVFPSRDLLREIRIVFRKSSYLKESAEGTSSALSPPLIMHPHVLEVHRQDINKRFNPMSQVYSLPTSIGTTLFGWAGVQLFAYCCFALPFEDIIGSPKSEPGPARGTRLAPRLHWR
jgi:hypothetical protein